MPPSTPCIPALTVSVVRGGQVGRGAAVDDGVGGQVCKEGQSPHQPPGICQRQHRVRSCQPRAPPCQLLGAVACPQRHSRISTRLRDAGSDPSSLNERTGSPQPRPCPSATRALPLADGPGAAGGCWMHGNTSKLGAMPPVPSPRYLPWRPRTARAPSPGHPWTPAPPAPGSAGNLQGIAFRLISTARLVGVCTSADSTRHHRVEV